MANHTPRTFSMTSTKPVAAQPAAAAAPVAPVAPAVPPLQVRNAKGDAIFYEYTSSSKVVEQDYNEWSEAYDALVNSDVYKVEREKKNKLLASAKADLMQSETPEIVATRHAFPEMVFAVSIKWKKLAFALLDPRAKKAGKTKLRT